MRVVAGRLGGRRLISPAGRETRPTTDRVREAMFNSLGSAGRIEGALVADLYAGSGAIGIEALSRGAEHCVFVERDRVALAALDENVRTLGLEGNSSIRRSSVLTVVGSLDVDVVFADPPYGETDWGQLLGLISAPLVVAEDERPVDAPNGWRVERSKRYGRTWVTFLERDDQTPPEHADGELG